MCSIRYFCIYFPLHFWVRAVGACAVICISLSRAPCRYHSSHKWRSRIYRNGFGSRDEGCDLPDGVAGAQTDPLGDGAVLTLSFGKLLLGAEGLVALCGKLTLKFCFSVFRVLTGERKTAKMAHVFFENGGNRVVTYRHLEG